MGKFGFRETIEWYNRNAVAYDEVTAKTANMDQIDEFVGALFNGARVLDAGCGAGRDCFLLKHAGLDPVGLDISTGLLERARKKYPQIKFVEGSFLDLPFKDCEFDGVWAHASLVHLETVGDVEKSLEEFSRVLKPQGILHVLVKAQSGDEKTAVVTDVVSGHDRFFQYFLEKEIKDLITKAGFGVIKSEKYNEAEKEKGGRTEVEWVCVLGRKG